MSCRNVLKVIAVIFWNNSLEHYAGLHIFAYMVYVYINVSTISFCIVQHNRMKIENRLTLELPWICL